MPRTVQPRLPLRPPLEASRALSALDRLDREKALLSLLRWALPGAIFKTLLAGAMPRRLAREMPPEAWAGLARSLARDTPEFGLLLAETLHDRLGWDREPATLEEYERLCRERPLEGLWVGAIAEGKTVRKAYPRLAAECLRLYRSSPQCPPPSWDYVEVLMQLHANTLRELERAEEDGERAGKERDSERQRLEALRDELKRLRRENAELRGQKAESDRRADSLARQARAAGTPADTARIEELERRLRKVEKEREHLTRELERRSDAGPLPTATPEEGGTEVTRPPAGPSEAPPPTAADETSWSLGDDPNPRRRVLRQMLKKLVKKGKIGASHTHADNVHRGVADHEKGLAKRGIELLLAEGYLLRKVSNSELHVAVNPERIAEVRALIAGEVPNPRLARFVEGLDART